MCSGGLASGGQVSAYVANHEDLPLIIAMKVDADDVAGALAAAAEMSLRQDSLIAVGELVMPDAAAKRGHRTG